METRYKIDFTVFGDKLLPFSLRAGTLTSLLRSAFVVLGNTVWARFATARADDFFDLRHNGQVCYLRSALNAKFKSTTANNYFEIGDPLDSVEWQYVMTENVGDGHSLATREPTGDDALFATSEAVANNLCTFVVYVPSDLYATRLPLIKRFVDKYRLPTRQPQYEPKYS